MPTPRSKCPRCNGEKTTVFYEDGFIKRHQCKKCKGTGRSAGASNERQPVDAQQTLQGPPSVSAGGEQKQEVEPLPLPEEKARLVRQIRRPRGDEDFVSLHHVVVTLRSRFRTLFSYYRRKQIEEESARTTATQYCRREMRRTRMAILAVLGRGLGVEIATVETAAAHTKALWAAVDAYEGRKP